MKKIFDLIGVGIGPSNLSLAVMTDKIKKLNTIFFDKKTHFTWHHGMMLRDSELQVHYLKDLVTPIDPTSAYSFISYLVAQNKFFHFINRKTDTVTRKEFELYYQWVVSNLNNLFFSNEITNVNVRDDYFELRTNQELYLTKNIVCGTGQTPFIPDIFNQYLGKSVFHNIDYVHQLKEKDISGKNIVVIGGGQSGAEIFHNLLSQHESALPRKITWVSRRLNFQPVEDGCFSREIFTPFYNRYFHSLPEHSRQLFLEELHLSGDGIEPALVDNIYRKIYEMKYLFLSNTKITLLPANSAYAVRKNYNTYEINIKNILSDEIKTINADIIICATGFKFMLPSFLEKILMPDDLSRISKDYSIHKPSFGDKKIFIQNGAKQTHGLADPYLSTSAWRNAVIVNSILGENFYNTSNDQPLLSWDNDTSSNSESYVKNVLLRENINV